MLTSDFVFKIFLFYLPLVFALCVHEWAHAWMAKKKGDLTAFHSGRLTLNPLSHMDLIGTVIFPLFFIFISSSVFFGWAKPVPVNEHALKNPRKDMFWIAFAGPLSNMILSFIAVFALGFVLIAKTHYAAIPDSIVAMAKNFIYLNLFLCFFNLLPLHPLDGGKVLARFLPFRWNAFLEENQNYLTMGLIFLIFTGGFHYLAKPVIFIGEWLVWASGSLALLFL